VNAPDRAGGLNGSSPERMVEIWRRIYTALNEAHAALEDSGALHSRDFSSPEEFAKARLQLQQDYTAVTAMRTRALGVFIVWDQCVPKPFPPKPKQTLEDVWNDSCRRMAEGGS
jgi:hypothetical protein